MGLYISQDTSVSNLISTILYLDYQVYRFKTFKGCFFNDNILVGTGFPYKHCILYHVFPTFKIMDMGKKPTFKGFI